MPGPLILGAIIDSACRVWQEACSVEGSCWIYNRYDMGVRLFAWWLVVKATSVVCYFFAQFLYRPPPRPEEVDRDRDEMTVRLSQLDLSGPPCLSDRE